MGSSLPLRISQMADRIRIWRISPRWRSQRDVLFIVLKGNTRLKEGTVALHGQLCTFWNKVGTTYVILGPTVKIISQKKVIKGLDCDFVDKGAGLASMPIERRTICRGWS